MEGQAIIFINNMIAYMYFLIKVVTFMLITIFGLDLTITILNIDFNKDVHLTIGEEGKTLPSTGKA